MSGIASMLTMAIPDNSL